MDNDLATSELADHLIIKRIERGLAEAMSRSGSSGEDRVKLVMKRLRVLMPWSTAAGV